MGTEFGPYRTVKLVVSHVHRTVRSVAGLGVYEKTKLVLSEVHAFGIVS